MDEDPDEFSGNPQGFDEDLMEEPKTKKSAPRVQTGD